MTPTEAGLPAPRRRILARQAFAWALSAWLAPLRSGRAEEAPRWPNDPFTLGVASGQPRHDQVVLWTRLAPVSNAIWATAQHGAVIVSYEVYSDEGLRRRVAAGRVATDASRGHTVQVTVRGLAPARPYWFRFTCGDAVSPVGRTRTAPHPQAEVDRLRLALASCQHYEQGWYVAHREIAAQDLDLVLFVGDYIYESSHPGRRVAPGVREHGGVPLTLAQYRDRYALYRRDPDLQAAHAAHPWLVIWDDHEVLNDYAGTSGPGVDDPAEFLRRRAGAWRAWLEHMPFARPDGGDGTDTRGPVRIHDRCAWGRLADLWTLDGRQYRSPQACPDPVRRGGGRMVLGCDELADPGRSLLGPAQEQWLAAGLADSRRAWQLVAQTTLISPAGLDTPLGRSVHTDGWDGYPRARERLMQAIAASGSRNVVTLGGDVHMHVAADLRLRPGDAASPVVASEFVTTSVTTRGMSELVLARARAGNPDLRHARADERGYTHLEVTPAAVQATFRGTAHPARADSVLHTQARWVVARGHPGVQPA